MTLEEAQKLIDDTEVRYNEIANKAYRDRTPEERSEFYDLYDQREAAYHIVSNADTIKAAEEKFGFNREEALRRITQFSKEAGEALSQAETLAEHFCLGFTVRSSKNTLTFLETDADYEGWDSSNC